MEIDYYWEKLSADPKAEQCGWLKDKYGVSWQVWPEVIGEMMANGTSEQMDRVTQAFLQTKKYDIKKLKEAYQGYCLFYNKLIRKKYRYFVSSNTFFVRKRVSFTPCINCTINYFNKISPINKTWDICMLIIRLILDK